MSSEQAQSQTTANPIDDRIKLLRGEIKALTQKVKDLHYHPFFQLTPLESFGPADLDEMHASIILAYRHLEDAAMRLGKVIQAYDGGKSVYDS